MTAPMKAGAPRAASSRRGRVVVPKNAKDNTAAHSLLVDQVRLALGREPGLVLWPNAVKHVQVLTHDGKIIRMCTGLCVGSSDLVGLLEPGRFIGIEVKTGAAFAKPHQETWLELVRARGGFATVVYSVDEARAAIQRAREGLFQ